MRLLNQPRNGVDFDQTAEPVNPRAGQVWRERSSAGLILGDWEWSGSLWLSVQRFASMGNRVLSPSMGNVTYADSARIDRPVWIESVMVRAFVAATANATNYWSIEPLRATFMSLSNGGFGGTGSLIPSLPFFLVMTPDAWISQSWNINQVVNPVQGGYTFCTSFLNKIESPGPVAAVGRCTIREVRA